MAHSDALFRARLMAALETQVAKALASDADYGLEGRGKTKSSPLQRERAQRLLADTQELTRIEVAIPWGKWAAACEEEIRRASQFASLGPAHAALPGQLAIVMPRMAGEYLAERFDSEAAMAAAFSDIEWFLAGNNLDGAPPWKFRAACFDEAGLAEAASRYERVLKAAMPVLWDLIAPGRPRPRLRFGRLGFGMYYGRFCPSPAGPGVIGVHTRFAALPSILARHNALGERGPCGCIEKADISGREIGATLVHELTHAASCRVLSLDQADPAVLARIRANKARGERLMGLRQIGLLQVGITTNGLDHDYMRTVSSYQIVLAAPSRIARLSEGLTESVARGFLAEAKRLVPDPLLWSLPNPDEPQAYELETRLVERIAPAPAAVLWAPDPAAVFRKLLVAAFGSSRAAEILAPGERYELEDELATFESWLDEGPTAS